MANWKLRRAEPRDAIALASCVDAAYRPHISSLERSTSQMEGNYTKVIELYDVWVAVDQGQIIGGLVLIPKHDYMLLANIAVRPEYQGKDVGRAMLELTDDEALKQGYREIRLHVNRAMTEIIEMYRRSGWTEIQSDEQEVHKISMRKLLL